MRRPGTRRLLATAGASVAAVLALLTATPQAAMASTAWLGVQQFRNCHGGEVAASSGSTIEYGYTSATVSGNSRVAWSGPNPSNAQRIEFSDRFSYLPGPVTVYGTGGDTSWGSVTFNWTRYNDWRVTHSYGGITGTGLITHVSRSTTGTFHFNQLQSCTVSATATKWLT